MWQPWYNWNIRVTFHIWVGSIFDPQGNPYEVDTFDGVMLPFSGMNRSGGFLYAWLTNQDGTDELVVVAHVNTGGRVMHNITSNSQMDGWVG